MKKLIILSLLLAFYGGCADDKKSKTKLENTTTQTTEQTSPATQTTYQKTQSVKSTVSSSIKSKCSDKEIRSTIANAKATLPKQINNTITFANISCINDTIVYYYNMTVGTEALAKWEESKNELKNSIEANADATIEYYCKNPNFQTYRDQEIAMAWVYSVPQKDEEIFKIKVTHRQCR